jgi:hypothetical protein
MSNIQIYEQKDFTGGLNLRSDQFQLSDNESPEMLNVEVDPRGGVFSRGGMERLNPTNISGTWTPHTLFPFYGDSNYLLMSNNSSVLTMGSDSNFSILNSTSGAIVSNTDHGACFSPWGTTLYMAVGSVGSIGAHKWTGTGNAVSVPAITSSSHWTTRGGTGGGHMPQANHFITHANKMFAAGTTEPDGSMTNRLRWSDESMPENWVKDDYIDILGGGNGITGLEVVNGVLIIFKPYAIYALYGYDYTDFRLVNISNTIGCHSHRAMVATDSGIYFYSRSKGLFYFDGSNIMDIFQPLRPAYDLGYINPSAEDSVSLSWVGRRIWLSLPYSTTGTATGATANIIFDPTIKAYTLFTTADNKGVVGGCDFRTFNGSDLRLMIHATVPAVLKVDLYDSSYDKIVVGGSTSGFNTVYRTKWFDAGSYMQRKMFRRPDLVMKESETRMEVFVSVYHDFQESTGSEARTFTLVLPTGAVGMFWDNDNWATENIDGTTSGSVWSGGVISSTIKTAKNLGLSKSVQLKFEGQSGKTWGINSIGYKWTPRRVKG